MRETSVWASWPWSIPENYRLRVNPSSSPRVHPGPRNGFLENRAHAGSRHKLRFSFVLLWTGLARPLPYERQRGQIPRMGRRPV